MTSPVTTSDYQTQSLDSAIAPELIFFNFLRSQTVLTRINALNNNTYSARCTAWYLSKTIFNNHEKQEQINYFLRKILEEQFIKYIETQEEIKMIGVIEETLTVAEILESLGIPYLVGGSVASSIWGEMRYTQDIDLVADIKISQISSLVEAFSPRFYISDIAVEEAIKLGQCFNLIDNQTGWKIDIFILTQDPFQQSRFEQRKRISVNEMGQTLYFSSAEDTILQKLIWYKITQKTSSQQWRDILGILKLQQSALDLDYLYQWANILQVSIELKQALTQST